MLCYFFKIITDKQTDITQLLGGGRTVSRRETHYRRFQAATNITMHVSCIAKEECLQDHQVILKQRILKKCFTIAGNNKEGNLMQLKNSLKFLFYLYFITTFHQLYDSYHNNSPSLKS